MGFSHKNSKPLEQGQAKGLLQKLLITVIIFFYFFFEIRKWLRHLHITAFRIVHKGKHVYHNFIMPRNQFKKFL